MIKRKVLEDFYKKKQSNKAYPQSIEKPIETEI